MKKLLLLCSSTLILGCSSLSEVGEQLADFAGKIITIESCTGQNCHTSSLSTTKKSITKLICQSPFREYLVTYNTSTRTLILSSEKGDTEYTILAVEEKNNATHIAGSTVNNGPTFKLSLPQNGQPKFDFYSDDKLNQSDLCRYI